jgi:hypothetical protein
MTIVVRDAADERSVYESHATLISEHPDIRQKTAVALCRASLKDFPRRLEGALYDAKTTLK